MTRPILIVEDNLDNQKLFGWLLEDEELCYECVGTAEEGLAALQSQRFGLVLMDISLPGMDGREATRHIRATPHLSDLPVIAVTAHAVKGEVEGILASGVTALVTKPIDEQSLIRTIRDLL